MQHNLYCDSYWVYTFINIIQNLEKNNHGRWENNKTAILNFHLALCDNTHTHIVKHHSHDCVT